MPTSVSHLAEQHNRHALTGREAAAMLGVKPDTVATLARRGDLNSYFVGDGRLRRFHADDVEAFIESRRAVAKAGV